jgi:glyceraldehyde 3-phosphate dehydrogenase
MKIAINGFGRIGRLATRIILGRFKNELELVAINTSGSMPVEDWAYLLENDSSYGRFSQKIESENNNFLIDGKKILVTGEKDPSKIPWQSVEPDLVLECTGIFRKKDEIKKLLTGSVKKVLLSAPPKDEGIPMFVLGVNEPSYQGESIISCASCTTNCVATTMYAFQSKLRIKKAILNTIHAYTNTQRLLDNSHKDLRRARAAALNIIPTSTGAAKATAKIMPELEGIFDAISIRVPTPVVSLADIVINTDKTTSVDEINEIFIKAAKGSLKGILRASSDPLVSSDILKQPFSSIVDLALTNVVDGDLIRVVAWYDNEWGYTNRLLELAKKVLSA